MNAGAEPEEGPPEPRLRSLFRRREPAELALPAPGPSLWRSVARWVLGGLLALDIGVLLFALSFAHVTAEGPAKRSLRHSVAILTEVDALLADGYPALRQEAAQTEEPALMLTNFPVEVPFTPAQVLDSNQESFRAALLDRAGARLYDEGTSVWQQPGRGEMDVGFFSPQGAVGNGMDFLRADAHRVLTWMTIALAATGAVLAGGLLLTGGGYGRLVGLGISVSLAAVPFLILAVAVRFVFRLAADGQDDYLVREFLQLGQELTWAPIRNGIIFSVGGVLFLLVGVGLALWSDRRRRLAPLPLES